eukprot:4282331-Amphidinium_carterae.1
MTGKLNTPEASRRYKANPRAAQDHGVSLTSQTMKPQQQQTILKPQHKYQNAEAVFGEMFFPPKWEDSADTCFWDNSKAYARAAVLPLEAMKSELASKESHLPGAKHWTNSSCSNTLLLVPTSVGSWAGSQTQGQCSSLRRMCNKESAFPNSLSYHAPLLPRR